MLDIKKRDITIIERKDGKDIIIACDSCGGIGSKEMDSLIVSPYIVGYYTARVPLMEIISVGALPIGVINTLSVEMRPTGEEIIKGIEALLTEANIPLDCINGSTEENFKTVQTGIGVTVIGESEGNKRKIAKSKVGDGIYLLGKLKVGDEITLPMDTEICSLKSLNELARHPQVKEIIPVGSKGIAYETEVIACLNGCSFQLDANLGIDYRRSAGPATGVIFTMGDVEDVKELQQKIQQPILRIGRLV